MLKRKPIKYEIKIINQTKKYKSPVPIVADMFAQKRLCRITVKVIKNVFMDVNSLEETMFSTNVLASTGYEMT